MMKPQQFILLMSLLLAGGTVTSQPGTPGMDGGTVARPPMTAGGIEWPDDVRPLATLDGPAVLAAHAALQHLLARFPKEYAGDCSYSAKALEVTVGQEGGLYFVEINRRVDK